MHHGLAYSPVLIDAFSPLRLFFSDNSNSAHAIFLKFYNPEDYAWVHEIYFVRVEWLPGLNHICEHPYLQP